MAIQIIQELQITTLATTQAQRFERPYSADYNAEANENVFDVWEFLFTSPDPELPLLKQATRSAVVCGPRIHCMRIN
jgi:hypothetical protein